MKKNPSGALLSPLPMPDRDHTQGPADAAIQLVEYGDYECSYCGEAYSVVKAIQERLGERLCFAFRNFPLGNSHPHSQHTAEAAEAAAAQGRFWEMHDQNRPCAAAASAASAVCCECGCELPRGKFRKAKHKRSPRCSWIAFTTGYASPQYEHS